MTTTGLTLHVRCTVDLIAAAPVLLGFHPEDSVVMITAAGDHVFHARSGLPSRADPPEAADEVAAQLLVPARRNGLRRVVFLLFSEDERSVRRVWAALRRGAARAGIEVTDAVRVGERRYYPLRGDPRLREVGVAYDVSSHPFAAEAVGHGIVVAKDRAALVASAAPDPDGQARVAGAVVRAGLDPTDPPATGAARRRWGEWLRRLVGRHVLAGTVPTDDEMARLGWAVQDLRVRDAAWALVDRAAAGRHQAFWLDVTRRMPDRWAAAPAALLGWCAWQSGHGALAWVAVDRCREVAPRYGMAHILAGLLEQAVPPDTVLGDFSWDEGLPA